MEYLQIGTIVCIGVGRSEKHACQFLVEVLTGYHDGGSPPWANERLLGLYRWKPGTPWHIFRSSRKTA